MTLSVLLEIMESLTSPNVEHVAAILLSDTDDDIYRAFEDLARRSSWPPINSLFLNSPISPTGLDFLTELLALVSLTCSGLALDAVFAALHKPLDASGLLPCSNHSCVVPAPRECRVFLTMRTDKSSLVNAELKSPAIQNTYATIREGGCATVGHFRNRRSNGGAQFRCVKRCFSCKK